MARGRRLSSTARLGAGGLLLALAACSGAPGEPTARGTVADVSVRDFEVDLHGTTVLPAGDVTFRIRNQGPEIHELVVVRSDDDVLPLDDNGRTVAEEGIEDDIAGEWEHAGPGEVGDLALHLEPGRYVLFCNMSGHYLGGMEAEVEVR